MSGTRPVRIPGRLIAVLSLLSLVGAACGSTAPGPSTSGAPAAGAVTSSLGSGLSVPSTSGGGGGTSSRSGGETGSGAGGPGGGTGTTSGGGAAGTGGATAGGGSAGGPSSSGSVPGVTATTIYIGSYYNKNEGQGQAALGVTGDNPGDERKPQNVMIDWVNSHGGVAGRKLAPIYYGWDASPNGAPVAQQDQAACAKYFQDNKVFAVLVSGPIIDQCAKKAGAVELGQGGTPSIYREYPHRIDIDSINLVRMGPVTVDGLARHGYFKAGAKIGIVTWDGPDYHESMDDGWLPALTRHGLSLATPVYYVEEPQAFQDLGAASADVGNAILKFKTLGIDHVMLLDGQAGVCGAGCLMLEFMKQAESQQYYPAYGFNDTDQAIEFLKAGLMSPRQARGSVYINWTDFGPDYEARIRKNQEQKKCLAIMRKHGINVGNPGAKAAALLACEDMWFLQVAANEMATLRISSLTADNFIEAVDHLGYSYSSPLTYGTFLSAQRHDGIGAVRHARFVDSCSCYKWIGGIYRV